MKLTKNVKKCWQIKNCPASHYETSCPAFNHHKNCWEVEGTICTVNHDNEVCEDCEVYQHLKKNNPAKL